MPARVVRRRRVAAVLVAAALVLTQAACGSEDGGDDGPAASTTRTASDGEVFNRADVEFVSHMVPHHAQAIEMVTLTDGRAVDPQVKGLADQIRTTQAAEVGTMVDWLTAWGAEVPETSLDHANAHGGGGHPEVPGMVAEEDMERLRDAGDAEFPDLWLQLMAEHHEAAVEMAQTEQERGVHAAAVALAQTIEAAQEQELQRLEGLLDR